MNPFYMSYHGGPLASPCRGSTGKSPNQAQGGGTRHQSVNAMRPKQKTRQHTPRFFRFQKPRFSYPGNRLSPSLGNRTSPAVGNRTSQMPMSRSMRQELLLGLRVPKSERLTNWKLYHAPASRPGPSMRLGRDLLAVGGSTGWRRSRSGSIRRYTNANTFSSGLEAMRLTAPDMALHCMCSPSQSPICSGV
jgi:hypothetical protein